MNTLKFKTLSSSHSVNNPNNPNNTNNAKMMTAGIIIMLYDVLGTAVLCFISLALLQDALTRALLVDPFSPLTLHTSRAASEPL